MESPTAKSMHTVVQQIAGATCAKKKLTKLKIYSKLHRLTENTWKRNLGMVLESLLFEGIIVLLLFCDIIAMATKNFLDTDLLNPKYVTHFTHELHHHAHFACLCIPCIFFAEKMLHITAHGSNFFKHTWHVADLVVVTIALIIEFNEVYFETQLRLLMLVRVWKVIMFSFDLVFACVETEELMEVAKGRHKGHKEHKEGQVETGGKKTS
mmetsp:Transcript_32320/g.77169  ORF Transcript_32320/g.77169 Transcript_32320/m.77169 type:complete len:210 (+) Transcript_32320:62-691(+)